METFAGIGAQKEALEKAKIEHEVLATVEWDIHAIYTYNRLHYDDNFVSNLTKTEIIEELSSKFTLSSDGKKPMSERALMMLSEQKLQILHGAIAQNKNIGDISKVKGNEIPDDTDLLTYSFPCQDLSNAKQFLKSGTSGIERGAKTRSGLLWEIERILKEKNAVKQPLPKFLLMENVSAILNTTNYPHLIEWQEELENLGYKNNIYKLNSRDFGVPQNRERVYMLSILTENWIAFPKIDQKIAGKLKDFLRLTKFPEEREKAVPNFTPSREKILRENKLLAENNKVLEEVVNTISTKQDRNPNAGIIMDHGKMRYLTARECFLLMGFREEKFEKLQSSNLLEHFLNDNHLYKQAGNSIVVDVLVEIFKEIEELKDEIFGE